MPQGSPYFPLSQIPGPPGPVATRPATAPLLADPRYAGMVQRMRRAGFDDRAIELAIQEEEGRGARTREMLKPPAPMATPDFFGLMTEQLKQKLASPGSPAPIQEWGLWDTFSEALGAAEPHVFPKGAAAFGEALGFEPGTPLDLGAPVAEFLASPGSPAPIQEWGLWDTFLEALGFGPEAPARSPLDRGAPPPTVTPSGGGAPGFVPGGGIEDAVSRLMAGGGAMEFGGGSPGAAGLPASARAMMTGPAGGAALSRPDQWENLMEFGLRLMAASDPRGRGVVGPSLFGAVGEAGYGTLAAERERRALRAKMTAEERRHLDKMEIEREKIAATTALQQETLRLKQQADEIANQIRLMGVRMEHGRLAATIDENERKAIEDLRTNLGGLAIGKEADEDLRAALKREEAELRRHYDGIRQSFGIPTTGARAGRAATPEQTRTIGGKTYVKIGGQWYER